jgi:hypothetical protein
MIVTANNLSQPSTKYGVSLGKTLMWKIGFLLTCAISMGTISAAQTETLTLLQEITSKLPTGARFTARDSAGKIYSGHAVTHPAKRFLRRGSIILVFDDPVVPVTKDREGAFRAGNKMRLLKLGGSLAAAKLADDSVDGAIGATKARYVAAGVAAALIVFQKGGEAKLHKGDTIEVEPRSHSSSVPYGSDPIPSPASTDQGDGILHDQR